MKFHIMSFLELSSVGLKSKACTILRSLRVRLLFCYWFKLKSSLICHEPGREPAEVSRQGDGSPMFPFITKHGQNTTCFSVSQNSGENQFKGEKSHLSSTWQTWLLFCLSCRPPIGLLEKNTVYSDYLLDISWFSIFSPLFNPA